MQGTNPLRLHQVWNTSGTRLRKKVWLPKQSAVLAKPPHLSPSSCLSGREHILLLVCIYCLVASVNIFLQTMCNSPKYCCTINCDTCVALLVFLTRQVCGVRCFGGLHGFGIRTSKSKLHARLMDPAMFL